MTTHGGDKHNFWTQSERERDDKRNSKPISTMGMLHFLFVCIDKAQDLGKIDKF